MKSWRPWETIYNEIEDKEELANMLNLRSDNPFPTSFESFENLRNNRPIRKATAYVHPDEASK
jgi:hypothetical protein